MSEEKKVETVEEEVKEEKKETAEEKKEEAEESSFVSSTEMITTKSFLSSMLIGAIPIVGDFLLYKWSKDDSVRITKQNMCKAYLMTKAMMWYPILFAVVFVLTMASAL